MNGTKSSHPPRDSVGDSRPAPPRSSRAVTSGTGTRKRRRLRKEEIVAEATRLFAERGYEGASMGDLAERVGLRKASLFHHFASKDVLYQAVLDELLEKVKTAILAAALAQGSFAERLDALSDGLTDVLAAHPYAARLLVRETMDWGPVMKSGLGNTINAVLEAALAFANAGQAAGEFKKDLDTRQVIVSFVGIYFMPFALGELVEKFTGTTPFEEAFIATRKEAIRRQSRDLALAK